jgi:hypothetical protein
VSVPAPRRDGLTPLPRRVPQTSLAAELREEAVPDAEDDSGDFTAEHAASSLAGFQRGTSQARDDDAEAGPPDDAGGTAAPAHVPAAHAEPPTPPADR